MRLRPHAVHSFFTSCTTTRSGKKRSRTCLGRWNGDSVAYINDVDQETTENGAWVAGGAVGFCGFSSLVMIDLSQHRVYGRAPRRDVHVPVVHRVSVGVRGADMPGFRQDSAH